MATVRGQVCKWIETGEIDPEKVDEALVVAELVPSGSQWRAFLGNLLLWLGGLSLGLSVLFFVAYNWTEIGYFTKFGAVQGFLVLAIILFCKFPNGSMSGKVSLTAASILLGVLLALYGQTYQTGADPWQLFCSWAVLLLPWAVVGRFSALCLLWAVLMNAAIILFHHTFRSMWFIYWAEAGMLWSLFLFNTLLLAAWEYLGRRWDWLADRWAVRVVAVGSGVPLTWLAMIGVFDQDLGVVLTVLAWIAWLAGMLFIYRKVKVDLFILSGCCLSGITVVTSILCRLLFELADGGGSLLLVALAVIGMGTGSAMWLKAVDQEERS